MAAISGVNSKILIYSSKIKMIYLPIVAILKILLNFKFWFENVDLNKNMFNHSIFLDSS